MPFGDGTGPMGYGPMTGRGAGYCAGFNAPGFMNPWPRGGRGFGRGFRGRGFGRGFGWRRWGFAPVAPAQPVWQPMPAPVYAAPYPTQPTYPQQPQPTKVEEIQTLEEEAKAIEQEQKTLQEELSKIKKRIEELKM